MKQIIYILFFILLFPSAKGAEMSDDTSILGITLFQSTISEVKERFRVLDERVNNDGIYIYELDVKPAEVKGLKTALIAVDNKGVVTAINLEMHKKDFDSVFHELKTKYKAKAYRLPRMGNKYALFESDKWRIFLKSWYDKPNLSIEYLPKEKETPKKELKYDEKMSIKIKQSASDVVV